MDIEVKSSIFYNDLSFEKEEPTTVMNADDKAARQATKCIDPRNQSEKNMWNMIFDGAVSREGVGASVWISPPKVGSKLCS